MGQELHKITIQIDHTPSLAHHGRPQGFGATEEGSPDKNTTILSSNAIVHVAYVLCAVLSLVAWFYVHLGCQDSEHYAVAVDTTPVLQVKTNTHRTIRLDNK
jgi:hypothetical protein